MRKTLLPLLLTMTACDQLYVEAIVPRLCQNLKGQVFSIPADVRAEYAKLPPELQQNYEFAKTFDFDMALELPAELQQLEARFSLSSITLTAVAPTTDFGFLTSASVTLIPATATGLAPYTISYERQTPHPAEIVWLGDHTDLSPYVRSGGLQYALALVGSLPEGDVVADVEACASATVKVNYFAQ